MKVNSRKVLDIRSIINPGEMFISFWLDKELLVLAGDHTQIQVAEWMKVATLHKLIQEFEEQVMQRCYYREFIAEEVRPYCSDTNSKIKRSIDEILAEIFSVILPVSVIKMAKSGMYHKLIVFPDSYIHLLPLHLLSILEFDPFKTINFTDGICYSPSASSYVYACSKKLQTKPSFGIIGIGDSTDEEMQNEAKSVSRIMSFSNEIVTNIGDLQRLSGNADLFYIITHGSSPLLSDEKNINNLSRWTLLFDNSIITEEDFFKKRIPIKDGAIIFLSVCNIGKMMPGVAHEMEGILNALFYAGASTVISARWPVLGAISSVVFSEIIKNLFVKGKSISSSFINAIIDASKKPELTRLMTDSHSNIFFWGPYALYGNSLDSL